MKSKRGFTLVEIIVVISILIVIAGIFSVNMISTLNKNKEEENKNVVTQITSAAEAYVSTNPEEVMKLYQGYGYVDIPIGDLRNAGLLSEDLKDAESGVKIADEELVRVSLQTGDFVVTKYPLTEEEKNARAYTMFAEDLNVEYNEGITQTAWCGNNNNVFSGLFDKTKYNTSNYVNVTSKLYLMDNSDEGKIYTEDYFASPVSLKMTSCNVNPQVAGSYTINYSFKDPSQGTEKTASRKVYVRTSNSDVISFTAEINNNMVIILNTEASTVPIKIVEKFKDGSTNTIRTQIGNLNNIKYSIDNFYTTSLGVRTAKVTTTKTNSDGSTPSPANAPYRLTDYFADIINNNRNCTGGGTCYFRCSQSNNYAKYNGNLYRVYSKTGTAIKLIYNSTEIVEPYGQLGTCMNNDCCNGGRYMYNHLGDSSGTGIGTTMDTILNNFYSSKNVLGDNIMSQETPYGSKKISLLSQAEYIEITNNGACPYNYLVGSAFWLVDGERSSNGAKAYNRGSKDAYSYDYAVNSSGRIYTAGASKGTTYEGDYGIGNINTSKLAVRPTIQLNNPKCAGGTGSYTDPYLLD